MKHHESVTEKILSLEAKINKLDGFCHARNMLCNSQNDRIYQLESELSKQANIQDKQAKKIEFMEHRDCQNILEIDDLKKKIAELKNDYQGQINFLNNVIGEMINKPKCFMCKEHERREAESKRWDEEKEINHEGECMACGGVGSKYGMVCYHCQGKGFIDGTDIDRMNKNKVQIRDREDEKNKDKPLSGCMVHSQCLGSETFTLKTNNTLFSVDEMVDKKIDFGITPPKERVEMPEGYEYHPQLPYIQLYGDYGIGTNNDNEVYICALNAATYYTKQQFQQLINDMQQLVDESK